MVMKKTLRNMVLCAVLGRAGWRSEKAPGKVRLTARAAADGQDDHGACCASCAFVCAVREGVPLAWPSFHSNADDYSASFCISS